ncbi:MAG: ParB/RepB/Spo0J family partition protein [Bacteroidota bacterium]|uniref:ParB/RepB/Spo0J family partition protein n=1 Tax=Parabacteroides sp. FAFU027 TaxID=2922715 RepID=UPI001FAF5CEB|nr:ParB/RepB/Spo0J family partition protein [Parabacteroides sp. FAFU027]MDP4268953.1 ParB/RepB/Spo0J family partition protein [Bacteroidota bacterium]
MAAIKKNVLGRGLDALITMDEVKTGGSSSINEVDLKKIFPNPDQPRREFDQESLNELASSIRELGIIQPITLREVGSEKYQIIAGERRYRASILAGLSSIPAYIRTTGDEEVLEMALIENIQREDLNAIEVALAYQNLIEQYNLTQERLSERIGKKRTTIANFLRLLKLPADIQMGLKDKKIDMGHARALIPVDNPTVQLKIYEEILTHELSVRRVEELVKAYNAGKNIDDIAPKEKKKNALPEEYNLLKKHLTKYFKTRVQFSINEKGKGKISIPFKSEEDLERIINIFDGLK